MVLLAEMFAETWTRDVTPARGLTGRPPAGQADVLVVGLSVDRHLEVVASELARRRCSVSSVHIDVDFGGGINVSYDPSCSRLDVRSVLCRAVDFERPLAHHGLRAAASVDPFANQTTLRPFLLAESRAAMDGWLQTVHAPRWVNDVHAMRCATKPRQLRCAAANGFTVPRSLVTSDIDAVRRFAMEHGPIVNKALDHPFVWHGPGNHGFLHTTAVSIEQLATRGLRLDAPGFFQERLCKAAEYRVTVVGESVTRFRIDDGLKHVLDWRQSLFDAPVGVERCPPDRELDAALLRLCAALELRFATIDLIESLDGRLYFLEANPDGSYLWLGDAEGTQITGELCDLLMADTK